MKDSENNIMERIATFIVEKRRAFYFIFAVALIFSALSIPKVKVNNDITSYLPSDTETRRGLDIMDKEFITYDTAKVMISNVTAQQGEALAEKVRGIEGVKDVEYENDDDHFRKSSALLKVTVSPGLELDKELEVLDSIKTELDGYDVYIYSDSIDDSSKTLEDEMRIILFAAVAVIVMVLLFTSSTYMEVPIFLVVFGVAALLNMGTNYIFGEISFITKSIAIVLQLALAIDYAIIMSHRFAEEKQTKNAYDAIISALSKAILEISSSSLTTISGLAALTVMHLRIGMDMGLVLCKGILCSLLTVFLLMPGILLMCSKFIDKTGHKSFVPDITGLGRIVMKLRHIGPWIFVGITAVCVFFFIRLDYSFDESSTKVSKQTEKSIAEERIEETFDTDNTLAVIVPKGDHSREAKVVQLVEDMPEISTATALSNVEVEDGYMLTDKVNPREFAELTDMDIDICRLLFQAYGAANEEYKAIFQNVDEYTVSIIDMFMFVHEQMDLGVVSLDEEMTNDINDLYDELSEAQDQLEGEEYARMVFTYSGPVESEENHALMDRVREVAKRYYDEPILASNTINSMDLEESFGGDNNKISILTVLAVLVILMFTFKSTGVPILLVLTIQGSIWINFAFAAVTGVKMYFLSYLVVSSIQMGATIDYAIVYTNRYLELKKIMKKKDAAALALSQAFPTILTSGSIMTIAGFLIGGLTSNGSIASIGVTLGRGTLISIILVMFVLPQILVMCDKLIEKSTFTLREKAPQAKTKGLVYVDGKIRGYVNGYIDGTIHGVVRGEINAQVEIGGEPEKLPEKTDTAKEDI